MHKNIVNINIYQTKKNEVLLSKEKSSSLEIYFNSYIFHSEFAKKKNGKFWQTAIGLQQVNGLIPSKYFCETAKQNIDSNILIEKIKQLIDSCYEPLHVDRK